MDEAEFNSAADDALRQLEQALDESGADLDFEVKAGGVLELEFADGSKIIVNRHTAAREIWVAAKSGGFHFRPENGRWVGTRDGKELFSVLSALASQQAGEPVSLG
ncbi:MAG: iron donor protein CyaY [Thermomicrobiales bacterium]|jgi:CyaY protein|nr:MAG: iron donor protein CyaY [Thermomicrobiales bacterium]